MRQKLQQAGRNETCVLASAVLLRFSTGFFPDIANVLYDVSGAAWIFAFAAFVWIYGPLLVLSRK